MFVFTLLINTFIKSPFYFAYMISQRPLASLVAPFPYLDSILFDQEEIFQKSLEIGVLDIARLEFLASLRILPYLDGIISFEELFGRI